jgi:hypothetical protein
MNGQVGGLHSGRTFYRVQFPQQPSLGELNAVLKATNIGLNSTQCFVDMIPILFFMHFFFRIFDENLSRSSSPRQEPHICLGLLNDLYLAFVPIDPRNSITKVLVFSTSKIKMLSHQ